MKALAIFGVAPMSLALAMHEGARADETKNM